MLKICLISHGFMCSGGVTWEGTKDQIFEASLCQIKFKYFNIYEIVKYHEN